MIGLTQYEATPINVTKGDLAGATRRVVPCRDPQGHSISALEYANGQWELALTRKGKLVAHDLLPMGVVMACDDQVAEEWCVALIEAVGGEVG